MHVLVKVTLLDTRTNEVLIYEDKTQYASVDAAAEFWTEGQCGCDCNRGLAIWKHHQRMSLVPLAPYQPLPCRRIKHVIRLQEIDATVVLVIPGPTAAPAV